MYVDVGYITLQRYFIVAIVKTAKPLDGV